MGPDDVKRMRDANVHAFLVGEACMRAPDPGVEPAKAFRLPMKTNRTTLAACAAVIVTLSACSHASVVAPPPSPQHAPHAPAADPGAGQPTSFDSVDAYKYHAAQHIMRYNTGHTFSGKLPPMLPAVVVLRITVDDTGRMTELWVQRSPDDQAAAKIAMASMQRAGVLPRPFNLATGPERSLSYSETFLFNADYRFQIRTLAPVQTED